MNTMTWINRIRSWVDGWVEDYHVALPHVALANCEQVAVVHDSYCQPVRLPVVRVTHAGERIAYATIQVALDAAQTGERIEVPAGVFVEQLTIRQPVTVQGAGQGQTIIQAPQADVLRQSGNDWVDALGRASFAVVAIRAVSTGMVVLRDLTIDGRDQGYLPAYYALGNARYYSFHGIAAWESDVTLQGITVTRINEFDNLQLATTQGSADNTMRYAGMAHNESIFAESTASIHTLTLQHSVVSGFQQSAVLAWGSQQRVSITDNVFQGRMATYHTAARVIQLGCHLVDYDQLGEVGGVICRNRIVDLGRSWPMVATRQERLGEACGIALFGVRECLLEGNQLVRQDSAPWLGGTLPDGCYANHGIVIKEKFSGSVQENTVSGFQVGIESSTTDLTLDMYKHFLQTNKLRHNGKPCRFQGGASESDVKRARHEQLLEMLS